MMRVIKRRVVWVAALLATGVAWAESPQSVAIKVGRIHTTLGAPIEHGVILIRDGVIEAVGQDVAIPAGAQVIEIADGVATPGLIDAMCTLGSEIPQYSNNWTSGAPERGFWKRAAQYSQSASTFNKLFEGDDAQAAKLDTPGDAPRGTFEDMCADDADHESDVNCGGPKLARTTLGLALAPAVGPGDVVNEQSAEVTPHLRMLDAINFDSNDFKRLLRGGVTTVYVSADSCDVFGARGATVKTAGPIDHRVVQPEGAVKISMGGDPSDRGQSNILPPLYGPPPTFLTRRPTTRMGVEWVFRKAFFDAGRAAAGEPLYGADVPPAAALPVLQDILAGRVPIRVQARIQNDIFTALRLTREFKLAFILEEATEAYRCLPQLQETHTPVIFGPVYMDPTGWRARTPEVQRARLNSPRQLSDAGIVFSLTAQELRDEEGLVHQAALAARYGLAADAALRAITAVPAAQLGLGGKVGVLAPQAAGDVVIWSGDPLASTSRPLVVLIDGKVVLDTRR